MTEPSSTARDMLRHTVATLAYRCTRAVENAPLEVASLKISDHSRTAGEILAHISDLMGWCTRAADGDYSWQPEPYSSWDAETARFYESIGGLDARLASDEPTATTLDSLLQGPIADALTHVGQIALLRGAAGSPMRQEVYMMANIESGVVGQDQPPPAQEFG